MPPALISVPLSVRGESDAIVVAPKTEGPARPWIWRAEFFDHRPEADLALLNKGFHLVYLQVGNTFGCPSAMHHWDAFYAELRRHGAREGGELSPGTVHRVHVVLHRALDGGEDGLRVVAPLIAQAVTLLKPGGHLILEIGSDQDEVVRALIESQPALKLWPTIRDHANHPRVVRATRFV